jgi:hypothetical protein
MTEESPIYIYNRATFFDNEQGMTLRDHFAGLAMQGVVSSVTDGAEINPDMCAAWSYEMADAMLKARTE